MQVIIEYKPLDLWKPFYKGDWDIAVIIGGRGSGKTWNAGNYVTLRHHDDYSLRTMLFRDVSTTIKQSILQNIKNRFGDVNVKASGVFDRVFELQENRIKSKINGDEVIFTKGFRTSRVDQASDLKGFEDIDIVIIEEAEDVRDEERVNLLLDTLRKKGHKVIIVLNTPDRNHWAVKRYFTIEESEHEGFYNLVPKQLERVCQIFCTYKDNPHLDEQTRKKYDSYNDPQHPNYNVEHYAGSILGLCRETRTGLIFKPSKYKIFETLPEMQLDKVCYGLDFGYNHPTALTLNMFDGNTRELWTDTLLYMNGIDPNEIAQLLDNLVMHKNIPIVADSARPEIIKLILRQGFNIAPSRKGPDSVKKGIDRLQSLKWYVKGEIVNELSQYSWKLNTNKEATEIPEDSYNHAVDSVRYALEYLYYA